MFLTQRQFREEEGIVTFIGPSGSGKSGRSKALAEEWNCPRFEVDALIGRSKEMKKVLKDIEGKDEAEKMGKWMGMPWSKHFHRREKQYLEIEQEVMRRVLDLAVQHHSAVIDTTGSGIYDTAAMERLSRGSLMVYLEADRTQRRRLLKKYLQDPKPVCFNEVWDPAKKEKHMETLERCYPLLLSTRHRLYRHFADVRLCARHFKKSEGADVYDLIDAITEQLPAQMPKKHS